MYCHYWISDQNWKCIHVSVCRLFCFYFRFCYNFYSLPKNSRRVIDSKLFMRTFCSEVDRFLYGWQFWQFSRRVVESKLCVCKSSNAICFLFFVPWTTQKLDRHRHCCALVLIITFFMWANVALERCFRFFWLFCC